MKEKIKILDKNNEKLKLRKIAKKQKCQERGITLIALVVTIIILLILAGVTLNIALSDNGLFGKAKKAAEEYKEAQSEEEELISQFATQMYSEYVGATVEGYGLEDNKSKSVTIDTTTSGTDSQQTINTDTNLNWRVWDYDGNTLRIIGDPAGSLELKGAAGYNNGVWTLDHICKELYSNEEKGAIATNLKRTEIQKVSTYDYTKYKHEPNESGDYTSTEETSSNLIHFGEIRTYTDSHQYPDMWEENDEDWTFKYEGGTTTGGDKECKTWEAIGTEEDQMGNDMKPGDTNTTFKQSYYYHDYKQDEFINDAYYDLIFKKADGSPANWYWLAGRYVHLYESVCGFGLQLVNAHSGVASVFGETLCGSDRKAA